MKRSLALFIATIAILGAHRGSAQDAAAGPGTLSVTVIPGGATLFTTLFTTNNGAPKFGDYPLGGTVTYTANRVVGIEGQVGSTVGIVPYVTGDVGELTTFDRQALGIADTDPYLAGHRVYGGIIINAVR
jgi:hypothetical protein